MGVQDQPPGQERRHADDDGDGDGRQEKDAASAQGTTRTRVFVAVLTLPGSFDDHGKQGLKIADRVLLPWEETRPIERAPRRGESAVAIAKAVILPHAAGRSQFRHTTRK
ncbi:MAG: hypothetical protein GX458_00995 [Phyllobacteriaceae bacterium]|nr:hypothetical protein [Phyllobacteriaceae bacterium]